jgi:hypothetical protein
MHCNQVLQSLSSSLYSCEKKKIFLFPGATRIILGQRTGHSVPSKLYCGQNKDKKVAVAVNPLEILVIDLHIKY